MSRCRLGFTTAFEIGALRAALGPWLPVVRRVLKLGKIETRSRPRPTGRRPAPHRPAGALPLDCGAATEKNLCGARRFDGTGRRPACSDLKKATTLATLLGRG